MKKTNLTENEMAGWTHGYYGQKPDPVLNEHPGYRKAYNDGRRAGRGVAH